MSLSLKIAGVLLPCQLSGRCGGLLDADPAGCLGRAGCRHRWDPRASCSAGVGVPQAPAARRTSASPACTHPPPSPNASSLQCSPRASWKSNTRSELGHKGWGRKTIERVKKKLLQSHTDADKWNPINDPSFSSILMSCGKEISIANPALSLNEISDP